MENRFKRITKLISLIILIVIISAFPVFMSPIRRVGDEKEDHKKVSEIVRDGSEKQSPD